MSEKRDKIEILLYLLTGTFFGFLLSILVESPFAGDVLVGVVTFLLVVVTLWYAHSTHRIAKTAAFVELFKLLQQEDIRKARDTLIGKWKKGEDFKGWSKGEKNKAEKVCYSYSLAGRMVSKGLIELDLIKDWRDSITKCYEAAEAMIKEYRKERGGEYWNGFDYLYDKVQGQEVKSTLSLIQR